MMNEHPEFPQARDLCYLNHAAVAPWPQRAKDAVIRFAEENCTQGARHYPRWLIQDQQLRVQLAQLLNTQAEDIALVKNTSEALSFVASGLVWRAGDEIVITDQEFPSNRIVWEALAEQGVVVRIAHLNEAETPEAAIAARFSPKTRLLSVSAVQYGTGLRMDLHRLGQLCADHQVFFCVDAIQALGAIPMDVQRDQIDFAMADGHKWLLGPEGLGVFYVRPALREQLRLTEFGWHMVKHRGDYDRTDWEPASDARRFECGSPNLLGIHALSASVGLLLETGITRIEQALTQRLNYLQEELKGLPNITFITPAAPARRAGILTFQVKGADHADWHRKLMQQGVICANRSGGIRLSPHFYTTQSVMDSAVNLIRQLSKT